MADLPYELYWFDQQAGVIVTSFSAGLFEGEEEWCIHYPDNTFTFSMCVTEAHSDGTTDSRGYRLTLNDTPAKVTTAVANAQAIAAGAYGTPLQQLTHFKDAVCDAVKYNFAAAEDDGMPYGDPWQLVYVFDGDDSTDVVCEGHAKAFKYLCDLRGIEGVGCILASGPPYMYGESMGNHMWDVVSMDDGSNYLVDVTNCDEGASGFPDKLFVASAVSGSLDEGHSFEPQEGAVMKYVYFDKVRSLFSEEALTTASALALGLAAYRGGLLPLPPCSYYSTA